MLTPILVTASEPHLRQHSTPSSHGNLLLYDPPTGSPPNSPVNPMQHPPPAPTGACSAPRRDDPPRSLPLRPLTKLLPQPAARPVGASFSRCWRSWWCCWERTYTCTTLARLGRSVRNVSFSSATSPLFCPKSLKAQNAVY